MTSRVPGKVVGMSGVGSVVVAAAVGGLVAAGLAALGEVGRPPKWEGGSGGRPEQLARAQALRAARDRRLGGMLIALGILVWPAGLMVSVLAEASGLKLPLAWFIACASGALLTRGHRMRVKDAETVLEGDLRAPILYLRPFDVGRANRAAVARDAVWGRTAEQKLARAVRDIAPFVALGDPTDELPEVGPIPLYASDAGWRATVADLAGRAGTTILYTGDTEGLAWEIEHVVGLGRPEQIVLLRGDTSDYEVFRERFGRLFPGGLLEAQVVRSRYLYFDADWTPRAYDRHSTLTAPPGSVGEQRAAVLRRLLKARVASA